MGPTSEKRNSNESVKRRLDSKFQNGEGQPVFLLCPSIVSCAIALMTLRRRKRYRLMAKPVMRLFFRLSGNRSPSIYHAWGFRWCWESKDVVSAQGRRAAVWGRALSCNKAKPPDNLTPRFARIGGLRSILGISEDVTLVAACNSSFRKKNQCSRKAPAEFHG